MTSPPSRSTDVITSRNFQTSIIAETTSGGKKKNVSWQNTPFHSLKRLSFEICEVIFTFNHKIASFLRVVWRKEESGKGERIVELHDRADAIG